MITITLHWVTWTALLVLTFINGWQLWSLIRRAVRFARRVRGGHHG